MDTALQHGAWKGGKQTRCRWLAMRAANSVHQSKIYTPTIYITTFGVKEESDLVGAHELMKRFSSRLTVSVNGSRFTRLNLKRSSQTNGLIVVIVKFGHYFPVTVFNLGNFCTIKP